MAGGISGRLMLVFASTVFATAIAAPRETVGDGCDSLRDVVLIQLRDYARAADGRTRLRPDRGVPPIADSPEYCLDTAAVTTAAFGAAMYEAGIPVTWGQQASRSGDYCLSHYLEQCYPRGEFGSTATARQLGFVHDSWRAVSKSVSAVMPYGVASDVAVFETVALESAIARRLHRETAGLRRGSGIPATRDDFR